VRLQAVVEQEDVAGTGAGDEPIEDSLRRRAHTVNGTVRPRDHRLPAPPRRRHHVRALEAHWRAEHRGALADRLLDREVGFIELSIPIGWAAE
jgi:hypothetical protein